jgi:hypothetical protein
MGLYLPGALGPIARLAASGDGRYSMAGVRVVDPGDGTFRCEVTDGRALLICRGLCPQDDETPGNFPAVIPSGLWRDIFDEKVRLKLYRPGSGQDGLAPVRIQVPPGTRTCSLQAGDTVARKGEVIEGRFPDVAQVLPKGKPHFVIRVNPHYLATILDVLNKLLADEPAVSLAFWKPTEPMAIVAKNRTNGICYDCLLMPLTRADPPPRAKDEDEAGPTEEEEAEEEEPPADQDATEQPEEEPDAA